MCVMKINLDGKEVYLINKSIKIICLFKSYEALHKENFSELTQTLPRQLMTFENSFVKVGI